ncbi:MAG: hypothetical protein KJ044_00640, partial [Planctomycetes bacterium]|nr:hypothetical protein [Planctomycetota bacterium]
MAVVEIICPFCQSRQKVPEQRLAQPVNCLKCQQVIEEPFQHKVAPAQMQLNIALKGKIVNDFGTTQLEEVESRSDAYTGRKATASVEPEREELAAMGTVSEYTSVSGNYAAVPARTRVLTAAARTYLIGGVLIVLVLGVVTVIGLSLMEDEKEIRNVEGAGGNERVERHPNGRERLRYSVKRLPGGDEVMDGQWQEFYSGGEKKGLGTFVEGKE